MGLRDIGATLPPGFKFYPSDEELVCHYLYKKIANEEALKGTLVEIDLHTCEPWQLPDVAKLNANEWYFFSFRDRKYATGFRTNRATITGYWKATGKDRTVHDPATHEVVGMRKTLVFYRNRAPNGIKTGWIMHEFRLETPHMPPKEDWVLCRVFHRGKGSSDSILGSSIELSRHLMFETMTVSPPSSCNNQTPMPHGSSSNRNYDQLLPIHHNSPILDRSMGNENGTSLFHLLQHHSDRNSSGIGSRVAAEDTNDLFWGDDMNGMRFDLDDDGLIFQ